MLAVEHDMAFVRQIAQRVTVLHFGAIFAQGYDRRDRCRRAGRGDLSRERPCVRKFFSTDRASRRAMAASRCCRASTSRCGEGEIVAVIGRNGVGKSTLMKTPDRPACPPTGGPSSFAGAAIDGHAGAPARPAAASATCRRAATSFHA